jgi:hypothetical protein
MYGGDDSARNIRFTYWHVNKHEALIDREGYPVVLISTICVYPPKGVSTLPWWWGLCDSVTRRAMPAVV